MIAGVSSFGMGGTNCHLVLGPPPKPAATRPPAPEPEPMTLPAIPVPLSARTPQALRAQAERLGAVAEDLPDLARFDMAGLARCATTRARFAQRAVLLAADGAELRAALAALADGRETAAVIAGRGRARRDRRSCSPARAARGAGMGRELRAASPVFAAALDQVCGPTSPPARRAVPF